MTVEPFLDRETIAYMNKLFSDATPNINDSERQIWIRVGKREAALEMLGRLEIQNKNNRLENE
ncbi:MAG: hypothetical protein M3Z70_02735 [Bartonella sp.]|nr:hypothetical protein [Bartonella sp.]